MASRNAKSAKTKIGSAARASISFPSKLYSALDAIATHKKVSLAWVVREAAEKYVEAQWPLIKQKHS